MTVEEKRVFWAMYFAGIASLQFHPRAVDFGNGLSLRECAAKADEMLFLMEQRKFE